MLGIMQRDTFFFLKEFRTLAWTVIRSDGRELLRCLGPEKMTLIFERGWAGGRTEE